MRRFGALAVLLCAAALADAAAFTTGAQTRATYCNPLDLPYRFQLDAPSRREAADPTMVLFRDEYWLFASKSGGYWRSRDLRQWTLVVADGLPIEDYAPAVVAMDGKLYWTSSESRGLYSSDDPGSGKWTQVADFGRTYGDADLFLDDDGRLYMYFGLANSGTLSVAELDRGNGFRPIRTEAVPASRDPARRGWENRGDNNDLVTTPPWLEGSWMTKHAGTYYLQYAGPGTEFKTYADGVLTSDRPMGPFTYAAYSPTSFKPGGFIAGAGHSSVVEGLDRQSWRVSTMTISVRHMFERRLGLFPVSYAADGQMITDTYLGDYPHFVTGDRALAGWMLLSYGKPATASSTLDGHEARLALDEDIRTWWSARSGDAEEWLQVDLGAARSIAAVQINFADEGSTALGRSRDGYGYRLEISDDGQSWRVAADRSHSPRDAPHDYQPLPRTVRGRYVRITNAHMPNGAKFSLSGLRIFGTGGGRAPAAVAGVRAMRDASDPRRATVSWSPSPGADFYVIRIGTRPDRLFMNYQVYNATEWDVRSLTAGERYYAAVDAVSADGIGKGTAGVEIK